jgi:hypothetical protein
MDGKPILNESLETRAEGCGLDASGSG